MIASKDYDFVAGHDRLYGTQLQEDPFHSKWICDAIAEFVTSMM